MSSGRRERWKASRAAWLWRSGDRWITDGLLYADDLVVDREVVVGEGAGAEVFHDVGPATPGVDIAEAGDGVDHVVRVVDEEAGLAVEDDLGSSTAAEDDGGGA